jgi:hypothetical protein
VVREQRFEQRDQRILGNGTAGAQRDIALDLALDGVGHAQVVAQDHLHHLGDRRVAEIHLDLAFAQADDRRRPRGVTHHLLGARLLVDGAITRSFHRFGIIRGCGGRRLDAGKYPPRWLRFLRGRRAARAEHGERHHQECRVQPADGAAPHRGIRS